MKKINIEEGIYPSAIKEMDLHELELLCDEIRSELLASVSETGGHLASNLGIVELTVAIHKVFDAPRDKIVWDVGHQSYVHKMLTGRGGRMRTIRQYGGLSGFPKRSESEYDTFDTGHSSNSISAALGMAVARDLRDESYAVAAVIGDGAFTGGMVYEALNNAGVLDTNFIVILNDNGMSISRNRGSMSMHLDGLRTSPKYIDIKRGVKNRLNSIPVVGSRLARGVSNVKDAVKYAILPGVLFEELGFTYIGPVDGHDLDSLLEVLEDVRRMNKPVLVHCLTKKGKGYRPAELHPSAFHGVGAFDRETGKLRKSSAKPTYSAIFGSTLTEMAAADERIVAVSAAMIDGTGLQAFEKTWPKRIFDVGIAEEHAVTFAAGLAASGFRPFVAIYSTFLQRAYDQILIDVCMQKLPVVFCLDRAGIVGADGETHQGVFDLSYLDHMPGLTLLAPADGAELARMMRYALTLDGPCAIRYPRGEAADLQEFDRADAQLNWEPAPRVLDLSVAAGGEAIEEAAEEEEVGAAADAGAADVCILAVGNMVQAAAYAAMRLRASGIRATVCDVRRIRPMTPEDVALYRREAAAAGRVITIEDNITTGGFGSLIEGLFAEDPTVRVWKFGWPDAFIPHGSQAELLREHRLDAAGIADRIQAIVKTE